jgi:hypothetical protein
MVAVRSAQLIDHEGRSLLRSARWRRLAEQGAEPQRLLWTGLAPRIDGLEEMHYVRHLGAPDTVVGLQPVTLDEACRNEGEFARLDHLDPLEGFEMLERIEAACGMLLAEVADDLQWSELGDAVRRARPTGRAGLRRDGGDRS